MSGEYKDVWLWYWFSRQLFVFVVAIDSLELVANLISSHFCRKQRPFGCSIRIKYGMSQNVSFASSLRVWPIFIEISFIFDDIDFMSVLFYTTAYNVWYYVGNLICRNQTVRCVTYDLTRSYLAGLEFRVAFSISQLNKIQRKWIAVRQTNEVFHDIRCVMLIDWMLYARFDTAMQFYSWDLLTLLSRFAWAYTNYGNCLKYFKYIRILIWVEFKFKEGCLQRIMLGMIDEWWSQLLQTNRVSASLSLTTILHCF